MDKPGDFKTITIKINGKVSPIKEEHNQTPKKNEENDIPVIGKSSLHAVEKATEQETAAAQEAQEEDEFEWILPEIEDDDELKEYTIVTQSKAKKGKGYKGKGSALKGPRKKGVLPSILLSIFLAVLLGGSLGILMLKMVISDSASEPSTGAITEEAPSEEPAETGQASIELPSITGYMVQAGVFSTPENAEGEAQTMAAKGVPTKVIGIENNSYIYVGLADNLEDAKLLKTQVQSKGIETFAKEVAFGGATLSGLQESEKSILELASPLYQLLTEIITTASLSNSISSDRLDSLNGQLEQWNGMKAAENEQVKQIKTELDEASENIKSYAEKSEAKLLINAQQHLLNFLGVYNQLK
ncbi:SPOR domain-containing protein [Robertmurraya kyonggiensis]|uniref:SPOR domain-containing protein n=1 Tax=Robertmurraya kyonggiensis TaxID=1037680 RepID=UPI00130E67B9|nr:SPOR domain-containing protein [Robertmurraya kyonggiensis]